MAEMGQKGASAEMVEEAMLLASLRPVIGDEA
jgi:hypothetical protein